MKMLKSLTAATVLVAMAGPALAAPDPVHGKKVFMQCVACHGMKGTGGAAGPTLKGVVGRKAGTAPGFMYSDPMAGSGLTWTEANLGEFLANPKAKVKGTRMIFQGLPSKVDQDDVIAYIKQIK